MTKNTVSGHKWLTHKQLTQILTDSKKCATHYLIILLSYRHGLRSAEVVQLRYSHVNGDRIFIPRVKGSMSLEHPLARDEKRLINHHRKVNGHSNTDILFPITTRHIRRICNQYGFHHHQLRHTCGYDMAIRGIDSLIIKDYLGHRNIQNTMIYVQGAGTQFNKIGQWYNK